MAPFDLIVELGKPLAYTVFLLIGFGFGAVLEQSGFGDSRKLAAQFYFNEMTVLKVMFTGIIVACSLIFLSVSIGILDFSRVWVQPTYLWPGIVGGLIMGVGFIIGGFCPGTSIVSLSTLKIDGLFFVIGAAFGIFLFGETVFNFSLFYDSSQMGRFILPEWLDLSTGLTIILILAMAALMFFGAELSERYIGKKNTETQKAEQKLPITVMAVLFAIGFGVTFVGEHKGMDKYAQKANEYDPLLNENKVQVHPGELAEAFNDSAIYLKILDLRKEPEYNLFHLQNSQQVAMNQLNDSDFLNQLIGSPSNTVFVLIGETKDQSVQAWKTLKGNGIINLYFLDGGINNWNKYFPPHNNLAQLKNGEYEFNFAAGEKSSNSFIFKEELKKKKINYQKVIKIKKKQILSGGCS